MAQVVYLGLWLSAWALLVGGQSWAHRRYTEAMRAELRAFERDWRQLEKRYAGP